jgi:hypothetical protein
MEGCRHIVECELRTDKSIKAHLELHHGRIGRAIQDEGVVQPTSNFWQRLADAEKLTLDNFDLRDRRRRMYLTVGFKYSQCSVVKGAKSPISKCECGVGSVIARFRHRCRYRHR